ncbi:MAG TPA: autotransporter-associated beta strand repeat-containing protein, partial [Thermoanaerobaculia bacterium]|nr:autotransporter-associated beta strand repeat-containing protein [Thermoanaerobaculia bacterium]
MRTLSLFLLFLGASLPLRASVHSWVGPSMGGLWSAAANWTNGVPTSNEMDVGGTEVLFGSNVQSTDNIAGLVINEIHFTGGGNVVSGTTTLSFGTSGVDGANIISDTGTNSFSSSVPMSFGGGLAVSMSAGALGIAGNLSGSGGITFSTFVISATLTLSGTNTYTGTTYVGNGTLALNSPGLNTAVPGDLLIGNGSGAAGSATVKLLAGSQIGNGATVIVDSDGVFDLNNFSETIGFLDATPASASVKLGSATLALIGSGGTHSFAGVISGSGGITKQGSHIEIFSGSNTYAGPTSMSAGTLFLNGNQTASAVDVLGGYLFGGGTTGALTFHAGAIVSPGSAPAVLFGGPGLLNVSGNLTLATSVSYVAQLGGTSVGSTYDRIAVSGPANVNNASLAANVTYSPANGDSFTILTATGTLSGTFNGLPDGALASSGPYSLRVNYLAHAVTLTVCQKLTAVSISTMGATCIAPNTTGGIATVTDTGGEGNMHQWAYNFMGGLVNIPGQTGATYIIDAADFPGPGTYTLVCVTTGTCGPPK